MIKCITNKIRIKTEPLNWVVQILRRLPSNEKDWKNSEMSFFDDLRTVVSYLQKIVPDDLQEKFFKDIDDLVDELDLESDDDFSAYCLTKERKHPEFRRKMSPNSLKNLKPKTVSIGKKSKRGRKIMKVSSSNFKNKINR